MALIAAICPSCGAQLRLDESLEKCFCQYCGVQIIIESHTSKNGLDHAERFENLLTLAKNSIKAYNGKEAITFINQALEINPNASNVWLLKMQAIAIIADSNAQLLMEATTCGDNAIKCAQNEQDTDRAEIEDKVYTYYLIRAFEILGLSTQYLLDVSNLQRLIGADVDTVVNEDAATRCMCIDLSRVAIAYKDKVPLEAIKNNVDYQNMVFNIASQYVIDDEAYNTRLSVYGRVNNDKQIQARADTLNFLKDGLPEDRAQTLVLKRPVSKTDEGSCYIATAVYGSYNAPQVIVLRQYRDNVLAKSIFGRIFIRTYYKLSPPIAKWLKRAQKTNMIVRSLLDNIVEKIQYSRDWLK